MIRDGLAGDVGAIIGTLGLVVFVVGLGALVWAAVEDRPAAMVASFVLICAGCGGLLVAIGCAEAAAS